MPVSAVAPHIRHVIVDRDGVVNAEPDDGRYTSTWSQWRWIPGARHGLVLLSRRGIRVSVVTNQSGIGRGTLTRGEVDYIHASMIEEVEWAGGAIDRVLVCAHAPDIGCACRKPAPGLLLQAIQASGISPHTTFAVGDDLRDLQAAWSAGIPAALVHTGKGRATALMVPASGVEVFDDLCAFAMALLRNEIHGVAKIP